MEALFIDYYLYSTSIQQYSYICFIYIASFMILCRRLTETQSLAHDQAIVATGKEKFSFNRKKTQGEPGSIGRGVERSSCVWPVR